MATAVAPTPFQPGFRLADGQDLNNAFDYPITSSQDTITATPAGTQANSFQLTAAISRVTIVANANDGVKLPPAKVGTTVVVMNSAATNAMQVFGSGTDTINAVAFATGVSQLAGTTVAYRCLTSGAWVFSTGSSTTNETISNLTVNSKLTYTGARVGTFVANGVTPVAVANTLVTANSMILISLNTVGGTVGTLPTAKTIVAGTSFTVAGAASDTSTYNYMIIENQ